MALKMSEVCRKTHFCSPHAAAEGEMASSLCSRSLCTHTRDLLMPAGRYYPTLKAEKKEEKAASGLHSLDIVSVLTLIAGVVKFWTAESHSQANVIR